MSIVCSNYCLPDSVLCISLHSSHTNHMQRPRIDYFFHVKGLHCHHTGKCAGQWWLALRVHRVLHFAKSKVAEFLCKFKCLLPHTSLNFDLHVAPQSCWMRDRSSPKEENNFRCGCGFHSSVGCWQTLSWSSSQSAALTIEEKIYSIVKHLPNFLFILLRNPSVQSMKYRNVSSLYHNGWGTLTAAHQPVFLSANLSHAVDSGTRVNTTTQ